MPRKTEVWIRGRPIEELTREELEEAYLALARSASRMALLHLRDLDDLVPNRPEASCRTARRTTFWDWLLGR